MNELMMKSGSDLPLLIDPWEPDIHEHVQTLRPCSLRAYQLESANHSAVFFFYNKSASASAAAAETISRAGPDDVAREKLGARRSASSVDR
jgi:hypothetical protein